VGLLVVLWLIPASIEHANASEGLTAQVYNVQGQNNAPSIPQSAQPIITTNVPNVNFQWGSGSVLGGPSEDIIVKFTGSIVTNITQEISFLATADDGTKLYLDGQLITDDWFDKGGGGTTSSPISFTAGVPKTIELMYYENGGGAAVNLYWDQSGQMEIIPASAFSSTPPAPPEVLSVGAPTNLTITDSGTALVLNWTAPTDGTRQPERYAISFTTEGQNGWGIATGNVGDESALKTFMTIPYSILEGLMPRGTTWSFHIRSDNDTLALYSANSNTVTLKVGKTDAEIEAEQAAIAQAEAEIAAQVAAQLLAQQAEAARIQAETEALIARQAAAAQAEAERIAALVAAQEAARIQAEIAAKAEADRIEAEIEAARIQAEIEAKEEADRIAAEVKAAEEKAEAEAKAEADRIEAERIAEEERAIAEAEAEAERIAAEEKAIAEEIRQAEEDAKAEAEAKELEEEKSAEEEAKAEEEELKEMLDDVKDGKELTEEQKEVLVDQLLEDLKPGESISAEQVQASGVSYADLPPSTPIELRTSESGEVLIITAEVAANVELVQDPGALLEAVFTDPGAALAAFGSIGADMTEGEREEATDMVVATVVAAGAAINAAGVAAGGSTGGSSGGGGGSGGGSGSNSPGSRGGRRW
jgi:hypothetical protein